MPYDFSKIIKIGQKLLLSKGGLIVQMKNEGPEPKDTVVIGGKTYRIVTIGNQTWMAQNLDFETNTGSVVSNRRSENADYGRLYQWDKAVEIANSIQGWHLPTRAEWNTLYTTIGSNANKLKTTSEWDNGNGTDDFEFGVLPAGVCPGSTYVSVGSCAVFWTSDEDSGHDDMSYYMNFDSSIILRENETSKTLQYSVRLVKD